MTRTATRYLLVLLLAGCAANLARERRYVGTLDGCAMTSASTLTRIPGPGKDGRFAFTPGDGVLIIRGTVAKDGGFAGSLNTQPPGKPPFVLGVSGTLERDGAQITYVTPTCKAQGRLRLVPTRLLP